MGRSAVILAGTVGLSQLHAFQSKLEGNFKIDCFENQNQVACMKSLGRMVLRNALNMKPIHLLNTLKKSTPSYAPRELIHGYIVARAEKSDIVKYVNLGMTVRWINFDETQSRFIIHIENLRIGGTKILPYDYVVVATGHFVIPNVPSCEGIETVSYS